MKPVKIPVSQLQPGMMVVAPTSSWINAPYIYGKSGMIKSAEEIRQIIASGYTEVFYDPALSQPPPPPIPCRASRKPRCPMNFAAHAICTLMHSTTSKV